MDLESSDDLAGKIGQFLTEEQVYRIDHYLAKEVCTQNIGVNK